MENKILIILGMHRSGTSLITKWLHSCELHIGAHLLGPGLGNTEGHFEDIDFYNLHLQILRDNNLHDSGIIDFTVPAITIAHRQKIKNLVTAKNRLFKQWAFKDPRTCLLLNVYREILPDACYLVVIRDYQSVMVSLLKRTFAEFEEDYKTKKGYFSRLAWFKFRRKREFEKFCIKNAPLFLRVWIFYNECILSNLALLPADKYLVIDYIVLKEKDSAVIAQIKEKWGFTLKYKRFADIYNEKLFSKPFNTEIFIKDKQLIKKAENLTLQLKAYTTADNMVI